MKILIATQKPFAAKAVEGMKNILTEAGYEVAMLERYEEPEELVAAVADVDGLIVRRWTTAALKYGEGNSSIEYNNCIVPFMQVQRSSNVYIYMKTSNYYNNDGSKTFNLLYTTNNFSDITRTNNFNGTDNTKTKVPRPAGSTGENHYTSVVWNLGALDNSYKLAFAPDSKMTAYGQGILEVL